MQTNIKSSLLETPIGQEANQILRSCVHCGFCTATCPTYQLLGDELDSPRGRIYLIKRVLETNDVSEKTQSHLDRCLSCGSCETTCPSGVKYRRLLDIGREIVESQVTRPTLEKTKRRLLIAFLGNKRLFSIALNFLRIIKGLLPNNIQRKIPKKQFIKAPPTTQHQRKMLLFRGCVHDALSPTINSDTIEVLDKLKITVVEAHELNCCSAVSHHLQEKEKAEATIKHNIDILLSPAYSDVENIFTTASACSLMLKEYPTIMKEDPEYHKKALQLVKKIKDISEIIIEEPLEKLTRNSVSEKVAFHSPCTLQHGLKVQGKIENSLSQAGYQLVEVKDSHICCGSAGTYSILQESLSQKLLTNKIQNLTNHQPDYISTANIGCLTHIQSASKIPVKHWISLINQSLA